jgi:hypothetical protein
MDRVAEESWIVAVVVVLDPEGERAKDYQGPASATNALRDPAADHPLGVEPLALAPRDQLDPA